MWCRSSQHGESTNRAVAWCPQRELNPRRHREREANIIFEPTADPHGCIRMLEALQEPSIGTRPCGTRPATLPRLIAPIPSPIPSHGYRVDYVGQVWLARLTKARIVAWHQKLAETPVRLRTRAGEAQKHREADRGPEMCSPTPLAREAGFDDPQGCPQPRCSSASMGTADTNRSNSTRSAGACTTPQIDPPVNFHGLRHTRQPACDARRDARGDRGWAMPIPGWSRSIMDISRHRTSPISCERRSARLGSSSCPMWR